jgi:DNA-binding CsgD family transcriptional regulator
LLPGTFLPAWRRSSATYILTLNWIIHDKEGWMFEFPELDETAAAVYRALLAAGGGPASISVITGLPEDDIRAALGALAGLNLVHAPIGASPDWRPVPPEPGFGVVAGKHEAELARMTDQLAALRAAVASTAAATAEAAAWSAQLRHTALSVEPLKSRQDALAEASRLTAQATTDYMVVMPATPETLADLHSDLSGSQAAAGRGVSVKMLYHDGTRSDPATLPHPRRAAEAGALVRTAPIPPPPMVICDRQAALIPAASDQPETALCVREPSIVAVLRAVFDNTWDTATPLSKPATADDSNSLTPAEQALLRLLAAGHTDAAAAKRLGVSLRTVRRQMNSLMTRLEADSRFQAGLNAAQRGWLLATAAASEGSRRRFLPVISATTPKAERDEVHDLRVHPGHSKARARRGRARVFREGPGQ